MPKNNYSKWTKSAAASMLAFSLVATPYAMSFGENGKPNVSQNSASAAVLDIELLSNMTMTNNAGTTASNRFQLNPDGSQNVDFTISGASLAQASTITSGKKQVVLGVPAELQGLVQPNGEAQIDSSVTVRINEVPLVKPVLDAVDGVLGAVTSALSATPGIQINLDDVNEQLRLIKNLGEVGQGKFTAPVTVNADGSVLSAPIDDGLGLILSQNLNTVLTDLNNAIQALNATGEGLITSGAAAALNATLVPLKLAVKVAVDTLKAVITGGGEIINQLADAAALGDTQIIVPTKVTGPAEYLNTNPTLDAEFVGSVVKGNVITLDLFKASDGKNTVYYQGNPDDFAVPAAPTDVATTGNSTDGYKVTGKAEANSAITVYDKDGTEVGTGTADGDGNFTIDVPASVGAEADLTVTAKNGNGESEAAPTKTPADEVVAPAAPTDVATTGNSTDGYKVTGKAEPNSTVNVYDKDGNKVGTGKADGDGNFTIDVPASVGAEADLTVKAENSAGEGEAAPTKTPADEAVAPAAPTDVATTGNSTDGYKVTGKAEPDATVNVYDKDGNKVGTGKADGDGNFTIDVPASIGAEADLTVKAENSAGEGEAAPTKTPADEVVAPAAPTDVATTGNSTDGYKVTGKAEPNSTVNVYDKDGNKVGTGTADGDGNFTIDVPASVGAEADLTVKAENSAGEGEAAPTKTPADEVVAPGAPTDLGVVGNPTDGYEVTGKTDPNTDVTIYDKDGNEVGKGTSDENGNFTITVPGSVGPEADLTVKVENSAGTSEGTVKTPQITGAITVDEIKEFSTLIKGTAPKGTQKVKLTVNGKDLILVDVKPDGTFEADRKYVYGVDGSKKLLGAGDEIVVSYYGPGKQPVTAGSTIVQPSELKITLDAIEVQTGEFASTKITGTAGPDVERVKLTVNGKDLVYVPVNADGTYEFDRKYVYDAAGNKKLLGAGDVVRVTVGDDGKQNYYAEQVVTATNVDPVVISNVDKATYTITGTTDASVSKVQLTVNGKALATYDVVDGQFTITRKYVYDAAGNKKVLGAGDVITIRNYEKLKDGEASFTVPAD